MCSKKLHVWFFFFKYLSLVEKNKIKMKKSVDLCEEGSSAHA